MVRNPEYGLKLLTLSKGDQVSRSKRIIVATAIVVASLGFGASVASADDSYPPNFPTTPTVPVEIGTPLVVTRQDTAKPNGDLSYTGRNITVLTLLGLCLVTVGGTVVVVTTRRRRNAI